VSTQTLVERVLRLLPGATAVAEEAVRGDAVVVLDRGLLLEGLTALRDHAETRCEMLTDLTVVDYLGPGAALRGDLPALLAHLEPSPARQGARPRGRSRRRERGVGLAGGQLGGA
jgi:hypothetical protein